MNLRLQPATQADLPDIVAIYNSTIASRAVTADLQPVSVAQRQDWFNAHKKNRPLYVVKNAENKILGWGGFSDYYARAAYDITAEISVYLAEKARGQGVGTWLIRAMLEQAPDLGIRNVVGVIFAHNHSSLKLFRRLGFEQWGFLPGVCELDGKPADIVILGRKI